MTNISPRSSTGPVTDDPSWLYSDHGIDSNLTVTLDLSLFTENTHFPDGFVRSGTPLGKVTATGLYGPYDNAAIDGRTALVGFLYAPLSVEADQERATGAAYVHGNVVEANLPIAVDSNGKTDVAGRIIFI